MALIINYDFTPLLSPFHFRSRLSARDLFSLVLPVVFLSFGFWFAFFGHSGVYCHSHALALTANACNLFGVAATGMPTSLFRSFSSASDSTRAGGGTVSDRIPYNIRWVFNCYLEIIYTYVFPSSFLPSFLLGAQQAKLSHPRLSRIALTLPYPVRGGIL